MECIKERNLDPMAVSEIIVKNCDPFLWGKDAASLVYHTVMLESVAEMNLKILMLNWKVIMPQYVLDKYLYAEVWIECLLRASEWRIIKCECYL